MTQGAAAELQGGSAALRGCDGTRFYDPSHNDTRSFESMEKAQDSDEIEAALDALIAANPDEVVKAKQNAKIAGWLTMQALKTTNSKANPAMVGAMLAQKLGM